MTRINTNVSSIVAQKTLARSNAQLQESLTRLSTGLRINVGKDDPAGLIASESLRSDIISVERAITNSERANQLIATADSALGQVSSLLNDVRGLVSESANTGALSDAQIAANQLQVDSSLEAIDRISQTTAFQGRRLLDGSLDFITTSSGASDIGATGQFGTTSDAVAAILVSGGNGSSSNVTFTAKTSGTSYNALEIVYTSGGTGGSETVSLNESAGEIVFLIASGTTTAADIVSVLDASILSTIFSGTASLDGSGAVADGVTAVLAGGSSSNQITISATTGGPTFNDVDVVVNTGGTLGSETAVYAGGTLTLTVNSASTSTQIATAINGTSGLEFAATALGNGLGTFATAAEAKTYSDVTTGGALGSSNISDLRIDQANFGSSSSIAISVAVDAQATQGGLTYSGGALASDVILEVGGLNGFEVFNFGSGTTVDQISTALNLVSDSTGVTAAVSSGDLTFTSLEYGTDAFVSARALSGSFATYNDGATSSRDAGSDVALRINGVEATGKGLQASLNTSTLDLSFSVNSGLTASDTVNFSITGGGANFQLGPDVVSNQQARLGIQGVNTATLGGVSGTLFELRSGGSKSLENDVKAAAEVVAEVISAVTELRGRLGAFQKTTLETNIFTLQDTLESLTDAESSIRDADFAAESAKLTRAQILVQSGTSVLAIANSNPQNVLALLR